MPERHRIEQLAERAEADHRLRLLVVQEVAVARVVFSHVAILAEGNGDSECGRAQGGEPTGHRETYRSGPSTADGPCFVGASGPLLTGNPCTLHRAGGPGGPLQEFVDSCAVMGPLPCTGCPVRGPFCDRRLGASPSSVTVYAHSTAIPAHHGRGKYPAEGA